MDGFPILGTPDTGDTAWMLVSSALVLLMTPGLAFFYGGMVRRKGVLNMIMMSISAMGVVTVLWVLYGYSMAFGNDKWSFVEHRFVSGGRTVGVIVIRGLFRSASGTVSPGEFARGMGLDERSPDMPAWLREWSASCDDMSVQLRQEEGLGLAL